MFCGIVTHLGKLKSQKDGLFTFSAESFFIQKLKKGSSVAVNGACLTVIGKSTGSFSVELMPETLRKTSLGELKIGDLVNLELSLQAGARIDGHFVLGHVDGVGVVASINKEGNSRIFELEFPRNLAKYIAEKGSIAVNGVSLTVISVRGSSFSAGIIPYTYQNTVFGKLKIRDKVNLEVDVLARYLEKLLKK